ncbi:MAG: DUF488 domain-containing protein [Steroidobacteraceae bacterium]
MTVFTASYEGRTLDEFLAELRARDVRLVVDVREAPISRKPGFSKSALSAALERAGIAYCHIRALGCPKPVRDAYREDGDWVRYTRAFMKHLGQQQSAIQDLAAVSKTQRTALLCYEADFNRCHRTFVARAVAAEVGAGVSHITAEGVVREASGRAA